MTDNQTAYCYCCGKLITDFETAERVETNPEYDVCIWFCEECKSEEARDERE